MSDTPRTRAQQWDASDGSKKAVMVVHARFARDLERELSAAEASLERLRQSVQDGVRLSAALDRAEGAQTRVKELELVTAGMEADLVTLTRRQLTPGIARVVQNAIEIAQAAHDHAQERFLDLANEEVRRVRSLSSSEREAVERAAKEGTCGATE